MISATFLKILLRVCSRFGISGLARIVCVLEFLDIGLVG